MTIDSQIVNETESPYHYDSEPDSEQSSSKNEEEKSVGFWYRVIAYIIDVFLISSMNGIVLSPLLFINNGVPLDISYWTLNGIIALVVYYVYFALMTKLFQQTLGKMIVGIKVIQTDEGKLTWKDVFFREVVGRILHNVFFALKLLYLIVAFTREKQGIHDMIGNTRVVFI